MATYLKEDLIKMIKKAKLRITEHRLAVLLFLSKVKQPVTVYELVEALRKKNNIDQATVYRNLETLHDAKLIRRLDFNHGHAHYELETGRASHNLVCSNCEVMEKVEGVVVEDIVKKILRKSKRFKSTAINSLEIHGFCKNCA